METWKHLLTCNEKECKLNHIKSWNQLIKRLATAGTSRVALDAIEDYLQPLLGLQLRTTPWQQHHCNRLLKSEATKTIAKQSHLGLEIFFAGFVSKNGKQLNAYSLKHRQHTSLTSLLLGQNSFLQRT